jgi:hypothetical protein
MARQVVSKKNTVLLFSLILFSLSMQAMDPEALGSFILPTEDVGSFLSPIASLQPMYPQVNSMQSGPEEVVVASNGDKLSSSQWELLMNVKANELDLLQKLISEQKYVGADFFDDKQNTPLHYAASSAGVTVYNRCQDDQNAFKVASGAEIVGAGVGALAGCLLVNNLGICCNYHSALPRFGFSLMGGASAHYLTSTFVGKAQSHRQEVFKKTLSDRLAIIQLLVDQSADKSARNEKDERPIDIVEQYEKKASSETYASCFEKIKSKLED